MKRALLIGINYTGSKYELGGCINDINNIQNFIIENCEYKIENTTKLTDETSVKPTLQNIKDSICNLVKDAKAGDSLLFYYSGHGSQIENDLHTKDDLDEVLVPLDYKKSGFITDVWLYDNLVKIIPKDVTLWCFTDCCHSGTMLNLQYNLVYNREKQNVETGAYNEDDWINKYTLFLTKQNIETEGDVFMFSGCLDEQTSADLGDRGAFTNALLETLGTLPSIDVVGKGNYKDKNRKIIDILKEIDCRLNVNDFTQIPQLSIGNLDDIHKNLIL